MSAPSHGKNGTDDLVVVKGLVKEFRKKNGIFSKDVSINRAVNEVSFSIRRGETLGLVGESGCGKSTLGRCILRLEEATAGEILFDGQDVRKLDTRELRRLRRRMQVIFQNPHASLNPRMTVEEILGEPLQIHGLCQGRGERLQRIHKLLDQVGIRREAVSRYPHEFSGGQRQRICIARALAVEPEFIVCDEPVSALDVSIQAQIVNLMQDLQKELGLTYLFIAHDLKVVEHLSSRVAVMYLGKIVEIAEAEELYQNPKHPYTRALLSAIPIPDPDLQKERILLKGDVPSAFALPAGCHFHPRCPMAEKRCQEALPELKTLTESAGIPHRAACFLAQ